MPPKPFRAKDLADLLSSDVFDTEDAAKLLGVNKNSVEYAAYRGRITHVRYGPKKLFTRADLEDYMARRGPGRSSQLDEAEVYVVKG